jgi:hypothetical protein
MKRLGLCFGFLAALALAMPVFAGVGNSLDGNNGTHYNLNIIGVPKGKTADMTGSDRHTIFVPLNTEGTEVLKGVKISYVTGDSFQVLDGNATDADGALIQVPYEYCDDLAAGCEDLLSYNVFAVALGKPGGYALVEAHCDYNKPVVGGDGTCESTLLQGSFDVTRTKGQPKPVNITNVFRASGCLDLGGLVGVCDTGDLVFNNIWIFNIPYLLDYFWDYQNTGLKLMQVRFYPTTSGSIGIVP